MPPTEPTTAADLIRAALDQAADLLQRAVAVWHDTAKRYPVRAEVLPVCRLHDGSVAQVMVDGSGGLRVGETVHHYFYSALGMASMDRPLHVVLADAQRILTGAQRVTRRVERICGAAQAEWEAATQQANTVAGRTIAALASARLAAEKP